MRRLFLSPHNDDEALFAAFTLVRHHPLVVVVTDSQVQFKRGDGITADQRWRETVNACGVLGCEAVRLGIPDDEITDALVERALRAKYPEQDWDVVYAPALQGGHPHHDIVHRVARAIYGRKLAAYCTYSATSKSYANEGQREIHGMPYEHKMKREALACYTSQHGRSGHHFKAVQGKPEWLTY